MRSAVERELKDVVAEFPRPDEATTRSVEAAVLALRTRTRRRLRGAFSVRALTVAVALGAAFLVGTTSTATGVDAYGTAADDPTLVVRKYQIGGMTRLDFSGRIPDSRAGEYVEILERVCGTQHFRISMGASTERGGIWSKSDVYFSTTTTYVARWAGRLSDEVTVRSPLFVVALPQKNRRWRIMVSSRVQSMAGRPLVLQRRTPSNTWVRFRTVRLERGRDFSTYEAVVRIPTRGMFVRALVPQASARPCHDAIASRGWPT